MSSIDTVIFDLDGTITVPFLNFNAIRQDMGLDPDSGPILELMENMTDDQRARAKVVLDRHETIAVEQSTLNDGAKQTLDKLRAENINIGILTRNTRKNTFAVANKHGLKFDAIVAREDGPAKPDAFGVTHLCEHFGTTPEKTLVVGDFLYDLLSAKAAGATAILINSAKDSANFRIHADHIINSLTELFDIIENR